MESDKLTTYIYKIIDQLYLFALNLKKELFIGKKLISNSNFN